MVPLKNIYWTDYSHSIISYELWVMSYGLRVITGTAATGIRDISVKLF